MQLKCMNCGWIGDFDETNGGFCPLCSQKINLNIAKINNLTLI